MGQNPVFQCKIPLVGPKTPFLGQNVAYPPGDPPPDPPFGPQNPYFWPPGPPKWAFLDPPGPLVAFVRPPPPGTPPLRTPQNPVKTHLKPPFFESQALGTPPGLRFGPVSTFVRPPSRDPPDPPPRGPPDPENPSLGLPRDRLSESCSSIWALRTPFLDPPIH